MKITDRVKQAYKGFTANNINLADGRRLAERFRRFGNNTLVQDWSQTIISDEDMYTGYSFAAINNRANATAQLATEHLMTKASRNIMDKAKQDEEPIVHPYLDLIDESPTFSNYKFWYDISTYMDLEGIYYLMAVRNRSASLTGEIQEFKLLNPFEIKRVINEKTKELGGYVEHRDGLVREIPTHMIIELPRLNPFSRTEPYSIADASKDSQYTLKQASDHTRHTIQKNISSPGIVTVNDEELALDPNRFENFKARVMGKQRGEPIFGAGKGSITWDDMQIDLDKSALDKVNDVNLNSLIAVTGNSKTMFGIEQSGVTRETAKIQKDNFMSNHVIPQLQLIIDALNQDFKVNYPTDYESKQYRMFIDSPLKTDRDAEIKDADIRAKNYETYTALVNAGYDAEMAGKYVQGDVELVDLGEPKNPPEPVTPEPIEDREESHDSHVEAIHNQLDEQEQGIVTQQQGTLENAVKNIEKDLTLKVLKKVQKNQFDTEEDIIYKTDRNESEKELTQVLQAFYLVIIPLYGRRFANRRAKEFGKIGTFNTNSDIRRYIKEIAVKASQSHVKTVLDDLLKAVQQAALEGKTQAEMINEVTSKYTDIAKSRAKAISRTETNRAFTQAQYQADKQFIVDNGLENRAYKKWQTRSGNPCPLCQEMASRPPVPFKNDFLEFGSELVVTYEDNGKTKVVKQNIDYEPLEAGNLHTNCSCNYILIVE